MLPIKAMNTQFDDHYNIHVILQRIANFCVQITFCYTEWPYQLTTGSQVPLFQLRTDAEQNLKGALIMAGRYSCEIPEVTLFFYNKLLRGCRATKINASSFNAFASPNFKPLAEIGVNIKGNLLNTACMSV